MLNSVLTKYRAKFFEVHGYQLTFVPPDLTVEWLEDQIAALEWYGKYQEAVKNAEALKEVAASKPKTKVSKRRTAAKSNPFM